MQKYLNKFLEVGVLLLAVSVIAELVFGPNVAFFGTQVTKNLINLLKPIENRVVAYSRISEDRWDIVLDRGQKISLPSEKPELAVSQFLVLNQSENILDKKVERIDFRNKQRLTLTLRDNQINN